MPHGVELAFDHAAGGAVNGDPVAFVKGEAADAHFFFLLVNLNVACADDAALTHTAGDDSSVAGHTAA